MCLANIREIELFKNVNIFPSSEHIQVIKIIGEGTYSIVLLAWDSINKRRVALKVLKFFTIEILNEISSLTILQELEYVPKIYQVLITEEWPENYVSISMEYFEHSISFQTFLNFLDLKTFKIFTKQFFRSLKQIHGMGVYHRDIKPANIGFNPQTGDLKLFDWGFSHILGSEICSEKAGTHYYKAPEILIGSVPIISEESLDLWSAGCIVAELALEIEGPIFYSERIEEKDQLRAIVKLLGKEKFPPEWSKDKIEDEKKVPKKGIFGTEKLYRKFSPKKFLSEKWCEKISLLLSKVFVYQNRATASEILELLEE